ncbi:MAG: DUF4232 domain-containing protein [Actinobacteria bacterium]|nr:DUF4232 domain-containing protein [Actinomycetota bacterium]
MSDGRPRPRTEDDLRAAYQLAAQDAPQRATVLAGVLEHRDRRQRGFGAPIAGIVAVLAVIGVLVGIALSDSHPRRTTNGAAASPRIGDENVSLHATPSGLASAGASAGGGSANAGSTSTTIGPNVSPSPLIPPIYPSAGHTCAPSEVSVSIVWSAGGNAAYGQITALNTSTAACDLLVKPAVTPLTPSGSPIAVRMVQSQEAALGPQRLLPGATARAQVTWNGWCGIALGNTAQLSWGSGTVTAASSPPDRSQAGHCPANPELATMTSTYFSPLH